MHTWAIPATQGIRRLSGSQLSERNHWYFSQMGLHIFKIFCTAVFPHASNLQVHVIVAPAYQSPEVGQDAYGNKIALE